MEISVISDTISTVVYSTQGLAFSNFLLNRSYNILSLSDSPSDKTPAPPSSSAVPFCISAAVPPPTRTLTKPRLRRTRRVKQKSLIGDHDGSEGDGFFVFSDGGEFNNRDGYFGSSGGGRGWNFGGYGGANWEESSNNSISDPAFDFVYEVLCWIAMSNCLHFAFKKVVRFVADGSGEGKRGSDAIDTRLLNEPSKPWFAGSFDVAAWTPISEREQSLSFQSFGANRWLLCNAVLRRYIGALMVERNGRGRNGEISAISRCRNGEVVKPRRRKQIIGKKKKGDKGEKDLHADKKQKVIY